jgi:hypothetical protein
MIPMVDTAVNCSDCDAALSLESILVELVERDIQPETGTEKRDVTIECPECRSDVTIQPAEIAVHITVEEALGTFHEVRSEARIQSERSVDWEAIMEREREQAERADRIDDLAKNL